MLDYPLAFFGAEIEAAGMPTKAKDDTSAGMWAARGHLVAQLPGSSITPFILAGGGALGAASDSMGSNDASINLGLGVKVVLDEHLRVRLDLRDNLSQKFDAAERVQTHHPEILFGITFTPERRRPDSDGDGVNDFRDACPRMSGEYAGCPAPDTDKDGVLDDVDKCPEVASTHASGCPDGDGDGIEDAKDACPEIAGTTPGGCPEKECKVLDSDGDGKTDDADQCPTEAAATLSGCPVRDEDSDGIDDSKDECPSEERKPRPIDDGPAAGAAPSRRGH